MTANDEISRNLGHLNQSGAIQASGITEKGILDFCFGAYDNDGKERLLNLTNPQLSPQFVSKFVQVRANLKLDYEEHFERSAECLKISPKIVVSHRKIASPRKIDQKNRLKVSKVS